MIRSVVVRVAGDNSSLRSTLLNSTAELEAAQRKWSTSTDRSTAKVAALNAVAATAGVALVTMFTGAGVAAAGFENRMRNVNSIAQLSESALAATSRRVLAITREVPRSANDLADGLYQISSSGFSAADGLNVLEASAKAAAAGQTTTATAAQAIAASINAYGLSAKDATDVSDTLFSTVDKGVISFEQLSQFLGTVVGTAAAARVPLDQLGAAVATLTLAGQTPEVAFNGLNNLLRKIVNPTEELSAVFASFGYETGQAALDARGLSGVVQDLLQVTGGSAASLQGLLQDFEAARTANSLAAQGGALYAGILGQITDKTERAGATQRAFDEQMKSVQNRWAQARTQAASYAIELGLRVLPAFGALADGASAAMGPAFGALDGGLDRLAPALSSLGRIGVDVGKILGTLFKPVGAIAENMLKLGGGAVIAGLTALLRLLESVTGVLADNPALVYAIVGAIAGLYLPAMVRAAVATSITATRTAYLTAQLRLASIGVTGFGTATRAAMALVTGSTTAALASAGGFAALAGTLGWVFALGGIAYAWSQVTEAQDKARESVAKVSDVDLLDPAAVARARQQLEELRAQGEAVRTLSEMTAPRSGVRDFGAELGKPLDEFLDRFGVGNADIDRYWDSIFGKGQVAAGEEAAKGLDALSDAAANAQDNVARLARETGLSEAAVASLAASQDVDLSKPWADSAKEVDKLREAIKGTSAEAGTSAEVLERAAGGAGKASAEAIVALSAAVKSLKDATRSALESANDVLGSYDPTAGMDSLAGAEKAVAKARADLSTIQGAYAGMTVLPPSARAKLAKAQAELADAEAERAKAEKTRQDATLTGSYRNAIEQATRFSADLTTALEKGLDPAVVAKLLAQGPEQAGPILQELVADHSGRLIEMVNTSEKTLSEISAYTVEQARLTALAVGSTTDALSKDLPLAMRIASAAMREGLNATDIAAKLGTNADEVRRIAREFGITLGNSVAAGMEETLARLAPLRAAVDPGGDGAASGYANRTRGGLRSVAAAGGGYVTGPGTTTSDSIPAWLSNREYVMKAAAVQRYGLNFMHAVNAGRLPGFSTGGYVGDARSAGLGALRGGSPWNNGGVRTVVVPVTSTHTNSAPINIENLYARDTEDIETQAARRRRLTSLSIPRAR